MKQRITLMRKVTLAVIIASAALLLAKQSSADTKDGPLPCTGATCPGSEVICCSTTQGSFYKN